MGYWGWQRCTALSFALCGVTAQAATLKVHTAAIAFGLRPDVLQASLSPDGTKLSTVEPHGARGTRVRVLDLTDPASKLQEVLSYGGEPDRINWCSWTGPSRLLCLIYGVVPLTQVGEISYVTRLVGVDIDGKNPQVLRAPTQPGRNLGFNLYAGSVIDWDTGQDGHVFLSRRYYSQQGSKQKVGLAVDDIDTATLSTSSVEVPREKAVDFISDGQGKVRLMGLDPQRQGAGRVSNEIDYYFRKKGETAWTLLGALDVEKREGFNPLHVDSRLDVAYGLKKVDGRLAAFSVALDGSGKETPLASRADVDIGGFVTVGRQRRVVGIRYTTDREVVDYFDPAFKSLGQRLSRALPNAPLIRFADATEDERKLLLWTGSDVDPGRYYLLDRGTNGMIELVSNRAALEPLPMGRVKSISIPAPDGAMIPAYLTLPPGSDGKNLPAIVMPHGGPSARDEWGFDWLAQFWVSIGYAVLQPNFRGSEGYGDAWFEKNGFKSWRSAIGDIATSGRWLVSEGIADPKKLAIFGWSYGGYAALQVAQTQPGLFQGVIAVAPVSDLGRLKEEFRNWSSFYANSEFIGSGQVVEEGSPARHAEKMTVPVIMFHGTYDRNVSFKQSTLMDDRLKAAGKNSTLVLYEKLDHQLDDSAARADMLEKSANFLDAAFAGAK